MNTTNVIPEPARITPVLQRNFLSMDGFTDAEDTISCSRSGGTLATGREELAHLAVEGLRPFVVGEEGSVFEDAGFAAGVEPHELIYLGDRSGSGFQAAADQGPLRYPRPVVRHPEVELARGERRREVLRSSLVARAVVALHQVFGDEPRTVVGDVPEVVTDAPPGDDGVIQRVPEDGGEEEAVDSSSQVAGGPSEARVAGRADEDRFLEESRAPHQRGDAQSTAERAGDEVGRAPDLLAHEILHLRRHVLRPVAPPGPLRQAASQKVQRVDPKTPRKLAEV